MKINVDMIPITQKVLEHYGFPENKINTGRIETIKLKNGIMCNVEGLSNLKLFESKHALRISYDIDICKLKPMKRFTQETGSHHTTYFSGTVEKIDDNKYNIKGKITFTKTFFLPVTRITKDVGPLEELNDMLSKKSKNYRLICPMILFKGNWYFMEDFCTGKLMEDKSGKINKPESSVRLCPIITLN